MFSGGAHLQSEAFIRVDDIQVLDVDLLGAVDLAGAQGGETGGVIRDDLEDDAIDVAIGLAPVIHAVLQDDALIRQPFDEAEGAGADETDFRSAVGGAVFLDRRRAVDGSHVRGHIGEEDAVGHAQGEGHFEFAGRFDVGDDRFIIKAAIEVFIVAEVIFFEVLGMVGIAPAVEVVSDRFGVEGRAIMEVHVIAQLEDPGQAIVADFPAGRQVGLGDDFAPDEGQQAVTTLLDDAEGNAIGDDHAIETDGVAKSTPGEGDRVVLREGWREEQQHREEQPAGE